MTLKYNSQGVVGTLSSGKSFKVKSISEIKTDNLSGSFAVTPSSPDEYVLITLLYADGPQSQDCSIHSNTNLLYSGRIEDKTNTIPSSKVGVLSVGSTGTIPEILGGKGESIVFSGWNGEIVYYYAYMILEEVST